MNIITLSTYPPNRASHGGQHRLKNIIRFLSKQGHQVHACGIASSPEYPVNPGFLRFPGSATLRKVVQNSSLIEDWAVGDLVFRERSFYEELKNKFPFRPDAILIEQPWLYRFAQRYIDSFRANKPLLVYGSQNIETDLKRDIMKKYLNSSQAEEGAKKVHEVEVAAARSACAVLCVSDNDAKWVKTIRSSAVYIASNGVEDRRCTYEDLRKANSITGGKKFALYAASGHPPNIEGFFELLGKGVGSFSPDQKLVVAGQAGRIINEQKNMAKAAGLKEAYIDAGVVSDGQLSGLLATAQVIILPITLGGGTNLKTAEALWAGRKVVATTKAMRGFEEFADSPGISVADDRTTFLNNLTHAMQTCPFTIESSERNKRRRVLWDETLRSLNQVFV